MPLDPDATLCYDFGYGERYCYQTLPADQLGRAANRPGLYAWYLRLPRSQLGIQPQEVGVFANLHASKRFSIVAEANLGEVYKGEIHRKVNLDDRPSANAELLAAVSAVFSPPIYIGISVRIRGRLLSHKRALDETLSSASSTVGVAADGSTDVNDTDAESAKFGNRIGAILSEQGLRHTRWLFVKIVYADTLGGGKLSDVEYLVNRIFTPFGGRR